MVIYSDRVTHSKALEATQKEKKILHKEGEKNGVRLAY